LKYKSGVVKCSQKQIKYFFLPHVKRIHSKKNLDSFEVRGKLLRNQVSKVQEAIRKIYGFFNFGDLSTSKNPHNFRILACRDMLRVEK